MGWPVDRLQAYYTLEWNCAVKIAHNFLNFPLVILTGSLIAVMSGKEVVRNRLACVWPLRTRPVIGKQTEGVLVAGENNLIKWRSGCKQ